MTEFVIPVMYKQVDKEDKDCVAVDSLTISKPTIKPETELGQLSK